MKPLHPLTLGLSLATTTSIIYVFKGLVLLLKPEWALKAKAQVMHFASAEALGTLIKVTPMSLAMGTLHVFIMSFIFGSLLAVLYDAFDTCCNKKK
jgi:hypothetical protein